MKLKFLLVLLALGCGHKTKLNASVVSDAGTDATIRKAGLTFPCRTTFNIVDAGHDATKEQDTGVPVGNDPNNCGQCGTLCGTYVNTGAGFSLQQGVCIGVNCNTQVPTNNPAVVLASTSTDCYDNLGPGWVVNTKDGAPPWQSHNLFYEGGVGQCINVCTDPQNCGQLGHVCPPGLFCQFCQCH